MYITYKIVYNFFHKNPKNFFSKNPIRPGLYKKKQWFEFYTKTQVFWQPLMNPICDLHIRKNHVKKLNAAFQWIINRIATVQHLFAQTFMKF